MYNEFIRRKNKDNKRIEEFTASQVAAYLEIDTALISKNERGERRLTREQVIKLATFYNVTDEELLTLWLSDKLLETIENDPFAMQGLNKAKTILKTLI